MVEPPALTPPPRAVPASLRWRVQLGGVLPLVGWGVLAIGGFLATVFVGHSELATWYRFSGELARVEGVVLDAAPTSSRVNSQPVVAVTFGYRAFGQDRRGTSFALGGAPEPGSRVPVEYVVDDPDVARIRDMQTAIFPVWIAFTLIFPLAGIAMVLVGWFLGQRRVHLMRTAGSAWGLLTARHRTSTQINNQHVYRLEFSFVDETGERRTITDRSHRREFFRDDVARHVLYEPETGRGCIVELLPGRPRVEAGQWQPAGGAAVARVLALPLVALALLAIAGQIRF